MQKSSGLFPRRKAGRREGVALIIVLAFVVILTGVIIAYFSRAIANRQISDSSASQTKVSLFAQGATDNIIADLQEEVVVNSSASLVGSGTATSTLYTPLTPASMLPQASGSANGFAFPANLLKVSSATVPFFTKNTINNASASIPSSGKPVAIISSTIPSLNGRSVSVARWNASYLLPLASSTDATPITTGSGASVTGGFVAPDWVLVARSGSNPTAMTQGVTWSSTNASTVIGRYAFAIYNEGGLLDANVAGYPSTTGTGTTYKPALASYKPVLSYADLTQLGLSQNQVDQLVAWRNYASAQAPQTYDNPSPFANVANAAASGSNYYNFVTSNPSGFLSISSTTLNNGPGNLAESGTNAEGQSDRLFSSRQELIDFMERGLNPGLSGTSLNILNYLGTFTRGINQPSYVPYSGRPLVTQPASNGGNNAFKLDNALNPAFPSVRVSGTGFVRNDGSIALPGEPLVKKRFALSKIAWLTYLGPSADRQTKYNVGDPAPPVTNPNYDMWALVNLYGVSPAYLAQGTDANIQKYFGLVWQEDPMPATTRSGTTAASFHDNEYKWFYQGHNEQGQSATGQSTGGVTVSNTAGVISRLADLPLATGTSQREPDFFELLKASVAAGSKAMSSMNSTEVVSAENARFPASASGTGSLHPYFYQYQRDTSLDYAIIQLGANIIDQAKVDGYSTRIVFNDGTPGNPDWHEFRGVENLPYLYRLNAATLKLRAEDCGTPQYLTTATYKADTQAETGTIQLKDTGVGMIMEETTIWNPYNANSPLGDPAPAGPGIPTTVPNPSTTGTGNFRLVADSVPPDSLQNTGATNYANYVTFNAFGYNNNAAEISNNANVVSVTENLYNTYENQKGISPITPGLSLNPALPQPLTSADNQLTFAVPDSTFFREPTVLARPNIPVGSLLQMAPPLNIPQYNSIQTHENVDAWQPATQSFISDSPNPLGLTNLQGQPASPGATQGYIGICAALYPILFAYTAGSGTTITLSDHVSLNVNNGPGPFVTYRLQYKDPNTSQNTQGTGWVTYDEKYVEFNTQYVDTAFGTGTTGLQEGALSDEADKSPGSDWLSYTDPRTSRFAGINGKDLGAAGFEIMTPGGDAEGQEWPDNNGADDVLLTNRPGVHAGYGISDDRSLSIGYIAVTGETMGLAEFCYVSSTNWTLEQGIYRNGLLSQNSKQAVDDGIRFNGDSGTNNGPGSAQTYYADPDGQIRGAMGNYVTPGNGAPATTTIGLPEATSYGLNGVPVPATQPTQEQSRPYFLHRPFRSVGELGYVFSGTPWKNIDFFTPSSGDAALLDVFTAYETPETPNELVAGVVNLNTRQEPVLQALLAGAYVDEAVTSGTGSAADAGIVHPFTGPEAKSILTTTSTTNFLARNSPANTTVGLGPLQNVSELVGRWVETGRSTGIYSGPSADLTGIYGNAYGGGPTNPTVLSMQNIDRFREAFLRPLAAVGNTRVWNLMIDVIAQTGRYPRGTTNPASFVVDGEQRYWVHVAIDRYTGQILDKQIEVVKE